jgi:hypothetical protein
VGADARTRHAPLPRYQQIEVRRVSVRLECDGSKLLRKPFDVGEVKDLQEFSNANADYLATLKVFLESHIFGLPGSLAFLEDGANPNE